MIPCVVSAQVINPEKNSNITIQPSMEKSAQESDTIGSQSSSVALQAIEQFMPFIDPGSETITWNGLTWNINNQRLFRARFEKFLNAPEEDLEEEKEYQELMDQISKILRMRRASLKHLEAAFQLLPRASNYRLDAHLCDSLINAIYNAWLVQDNQRNLRMANRALEQEKKRQEEAVLHASRIHATTVDRNQKYVENKTREKEILMATAQARIVELKTLTEANKLKREISKIHSKIEFQTLLLQFFMQRRFQHVIIGSSFYRHVYSDGENKLDVKGDTRDMFEKSTGMPPTLGTLESLAREAIREVAEGVDAFNYLVDKDELESATKRLSETFFIGEFMPQLRSIPREQKRKALRLTQQYFKLINALEVKDYALAESIIEELKVTAKDFDSSKPLAAIETAKVISSMHLAQAKNAALRNDAETLEKELTAATKLWPRNPALKEVSQMIFNTGDMQQQALLDFDRLLAQKNYRQIFMDKARYIAATSIDTTRQEYLQEVMENMQMIETAIIRSQEMAKRNLFAGAWEMIEKAYLSFSEDNKLNQVRADMTTRASDFVRALRHAQRLEKNAESGSSLAWYLMAQSMYPESEFAQEGILRLAEEILPDGMGTSVNPEFEREENL